MTNFENTRSATLSVSGVDLPMGTTTIVDVPVYTDLDGAEISHTFHAVVGARPGPVLGLHTAVHGDEWLTVEVARAIVQSLDPAEMSGAVLALPVANPPAFAGRTRNTPDASDSPDLNRAFGGVQTWITDQLAQSIVDNLYANIDAIIDFHLGIWGSAMGSVACGRDFTDPVINKQAFRLARAFGLPYVRHGDFVTKFPGPKSGVGYAGEELGIPGLISEVGGAGFNEETEARWLATNVAGVHGVMREMGILSGTPDLPDEVMVFDTAARVNPTNAGFVDPLYSAESMMSREVQKGELLGRVFSPHTLEVIEELRSPVRGLLDMIPRPYPVRPGDWAYLVLDLDSPGNIRLSGDEMPSF
ncbi:succinylglutamate desuccinylase/aspartoacylase family protein [Euzebya pacifica]|uniref:succinylglutamate desuccinylase/aspartoacylase family protein n=1 Tax=Euzebya pacifica TaxID=1608957 RepID=UPI0030FA5864